MTEHAEILLECHRFRVERVPQVCPDGSIHSREVVRHPGSVVILPLVDERHVCLIKNRRVATGRTLVELPAGTLEPPDGPTETAFRELQEETGFRAARIELLTAFYAAPGILDERMHLFVAEDLQAGPPAREVNEEIDNLVVTWRTALEMVFDGRIEDAKTILGLLWWNQTHIHKKE